MLFFTRWSLCFLLPALLIASAGAPEGIALPSPSIEGKRTLEEVLRARRSIREFTENSISLDEVSQLLWAAQGITREGGRRTAPSAGALYPLEIYLVAGRVEGLPAGIYRYVPVGHRIERVREGDRREALSEAALEQRSVRDAPAALVIAGVRERTARKYGERATRYVQIEVGHAAQNVYLQATAIDLGTVLVGAFEDDRIHGVVGMRDGEQPLAILPVGKPETR